VPDLTVAIRTFIDGYNPRCKLFAWTKTADQILTKANRQRLQTRNTRTTAGLHRFPPEIVC
jgi:hypothetical protein